FFTGIDFSTNHQNISRKLNARSPTGDWVPIGPADDYTAEMHTLQAIGKLTYAINQSNQLSLTLIASPTRSGGGAKAFSLNPQTGSPEIDAGADGGTHDALATQRLSDAYDASLKWTSEYLNKSVLWEVTLGLHHQKDGTHASDGSGPGGGGLASIPQIKWQRD